MLRFGTLLSVLLKLLSLLSAVRQSLIYLTYKPMRRVFTADKISVRFRYYEGEKEVGNISYNLLEGRFFVFTWPSSFSSLRKVSELIRLLSFASKIIKSEDVQL